jgi:hypothetical protein
LHGPFLLPIKFLSAQAQTLALVFLLVMLTTSRSLAEERRFEAQALLTEAVTEHVSLSADGTALELQRGTLIEDDGPAAGFSYRPNEETLSEGVAIRKTLVIPDPRTDAATLLVGSAGTLSFKVNGKPLELESAGKAGNYWRAYSVPPSALQRGANEFVISGTGKIWIARDDEFAPGSTTRTQHPNRSAKSYDGGLSWTDTELGTDGDIDGEYYVRLALDQYKPAGSILLPVVDIGNLTGAAIAPRLKSLGPVTVSLHCDGDTNTRVTARHRTSPDPVPTSSAWSEWQPLPVGGEITRPEGRYLQVSLTLATEDPRKSPRLKEVVIQAEPDVADDWLGQVEVESAHNERIVRSSIPFAYEPFDHPRLREFRKRYELDRIVEKAGSEFELIRCLAGWSAQRWERGHLAEVYPDWDALKILEPHTDGRPVGGFCQQYNLVLLQACESFGLVGRAISLSPHAKHPGIRSGHEVVEIWSNDFAKWVYMDGNHGWYIVDAESGTPLSVVELRERQLAALAGSLDQPVRLERIVENGEPWDGLTGKPPFLELRLIPRSNFLEAAAPLPLNQGMRGWFWTGHHVWTDEHLPPTLIDAQRVTDRGNWSWTLNQAEYRLEATEEPGTLRVHLDTETPGFDSFVAAINRGKPAPVASGFLWKLQPGTNRLDVRARNTAGREGPASWIVLNLAR